MSSIRKSFIIAAGVAAMGAVTAAFAGVNAGMIELMNQRNSQGSQSSSAAPSAPASGPVYSAAPAAAPAPRVASPQPNYRNNSANIGRQPAPRPQASAGPRTGAPGVSPQASNGQNNSNIGRRNGVIGGALSRNYSSSNPGGNNGGGNHTPGGPGNHDDHGGNSHHPRPPRVVYTLPPGYYDYYYGGNRYYNFGGGWYTPYGSSYLSVGAPYGLFMSSLPGYATSFDYDDTRYYLRDDTYYTYDRSRGGYVVSPSPYGDEEDADTVDEDLYIYPAQGQSEKQQADDRYTCHQWGAKESGYDPIDDAYDADRRTNYLRAMTACLTGKGYSVK